MHDVLELQRISTTQEIELYWKLSDEMLVKDVIPSSDIGEPMTEEEIDYYLSRDLRDRIEELCNRTIDQAVRLFFRVNGKIAGFCLYVNYLSEDSKCFILNYFILREYRNKGYGKKFFDLFLELTQAQGAMFYECNTHCYRSMRFWESLGFSYNGFDAHKSILLLRKPIGEIEVYTEMLSDQDIWQVMKLINGCMRANNYKFFSDLQFEKLRIAIQARNIIFFLLKYKTRVIGMCSIQFQKLNSPSKQNGLLNYFYIEPVFQCDAYEIKLLSFVEEWCKQNNVTIIKTT